MQKNAQIDAKLTEFRHFKVAIFTFSDKFNQKNKEWGDNEASEEVTSRSLRGEIS